MLPTRLQTTPYITFVPPNNARPVVYVTDTLGPEYPAAAPPPDDGPTESSRSTAASYGVPT